MTSDDNGEEGLQNGPKIDYIIVEQPHRFQSPYLGGIAQVRSN